MVGAVIGGGLSLIGGFRSSSAAGKAADSQAEAARIAAELGREGLVFQQEMFDTTRQDFSQGRAVGNQALGSLSNMFLPGGQSAVQLQSQLNELLTRKAVMARQDQGGTAQPDSSNSELSGFAQQVQQNPFLLASRANYGQTAPSGSPLEAARMQAAARFAQTHPQGKGSGGR